LFSDPELSLARQLGIAFQAPGKSALPVPTVYVIGANGKILFQHVDPNFQQRLKNDVILAAAKAFGR
jgi:peroxiredoxin